MKNLTPISSVNPLVLLILSILTVASVHGQTQPQIPSDWQKAYLVVLRASAVTENRDGFFANYSDQHYWESRIQVPNKYTLKKLSSWLSKPTHWGDGTDELVAFQFMIILEGESGSKLFILPNLSGGDLFMAKEKEGMISIGGLSETGKRDLFEVIFDILGFARKKNFLPISSETQEQ